MIDLLAEKREKIARQNGKDVHYVRDRRLERERDQQQKEEQEREREQEREGGTQRDLHRQQENQREPQPQQERQPDQQQPGRSVSEEIVPPGSSGTQNRASEMYVVVLESILFITLIEQAFPITTNLTFNY